MMAAASLGFANYGFSCCFRINPVLDSRRKPITLLRAQTEGQESKTFSVEDRARLSLEDLDSQLSQLSQRDTPSPSPIPETENAREEWLRGAKEGKLPELSTGFLFFLGAGLLLLTVVNNLLFYYFVQIPAKQAKLATETVEKQQTSLKNANLGDIKVAPEL